MVNALGFANSRSIVQPESGSTAPRRIAHRTEGRRHGPVTRLMSPGDIGEALKPFVFLDYFSVDGFTGAGFAAHPHSGIATHTTLLQGTFDYGDSTGKVGQMPPGSIEWMQAGGGVWHWGNPRGGEPVRGYQLWVALPERLEHAPARSQYVAAEAIPTRGAVRLLLGAHADARSPLGYDEPIAYLHVRLGAGERWTYVPPPGHDVAWIATHQGKLHVSRVVLEREMAIFEEGDAPIEVRAEGDTELIVGSAMKHPHPLVCGYYSVHTSNQALVRGEAHIETLGRTPVVMAARRR